MNTSHGDQLVRTYFQNQVREIESTWLSEVDNVDDWKAQRPELQRALREMLGLEPLPPRTDLKVTVTGTLEHEEFTVEKLHFQSMPGLYVTANLYIPKEREGPLPGVLYVCGHATRKVDGVAYGAKTAYQRHPAWYARHGYVALIIDTVWFGEIEGEHHGTYDLGRWWWWNRGYTPGGVETWNGIRALDYLASRPEVDAERLAVTGRSGGGAYSWFISALDDRVTLTVPTAGITDLEDHVLDQVVAGHCDCMYMINTERWNFASLAALVAPRPLLLANGDVDPIFPLDGVMRVFDRTRQVYGLYNHLDRFDHLIVNAGHQDIPPLRQGTYRWIHPHLKGEPLTAHDPADTVFAPSELRVFDELPEDEINTRIDELFVPPAEVPAVPPDRGSWKNLRRSWMQQLREATFAGWPAEEGELNLKQAFASTWGDLSLQALDFDSQDPFRLRIWVLTHTGVERPDRIVLSAADTTGWRSWQSLLYALTGNREMAHGLVGPGAASVPWGDGDEGALDVVRQRLLDERTALAVVAPRGIGPTAWTETERGNAVRRSFLLLGQTLEGMQAWDVRRALAGVRYRWPDVPVVVEGRGAMGGIALYAALFGPEVSRLILHGLPATHREGPILLNVRKVFDMPQAVAAALGTVDEVELHGVGEEQWQWPTDISARGLANGRIRFGSERPWLGAAARSDSD